MWEIRICFATLGVRQYPCMCITMFRYVSPAFNTCGYPVNQTKISIEFVPRDTDESKFLDVVDFGDVAVSVETVIQR